MASEAVQKSFYIDDGLTDADDIKTVVALQDQLQDLFSHGGFLLRKWNSSDSSVLQAIPPDLRESKEVHPISDTNDYSVEWNTKTDMFCRSISELQPSNIVTKRILASDIAKVFDVLGWFS